MVIIMIQIPKTESWNKTSTHFKIAIIMNVIDKPVMFDTIAKLLNNISHDELRESLKDLINNGDVDRTLIKSHNKYVLRYILHPSIKPFVDDLTKDYYDIKYVLKGE